MEISPWKNLEACCFLPLAHGTAALKEVLPPRHWFPPFWSIPHFLYFSSWSVFQLTLTLDCSLLLLDSCADSICFRSCQCQGCLPRTEHRFLIMLQITGSYKRTSWELEDFLQLKAHEKHMWCLWIRKMFINYIFPSWKNTNSLFHLLLLCIRSCKVSEWWLKQD